MQILIQIFCNSKTNSLREKITNDEELMNFSLKVSQHKNSKRSSGWSKLHSIDKHHGAINIEWDAKLNLLTARVVSKGGNPENITADFVKYILSQYMNEIKTLQVLPI